MSTLNDNQIQFKERLEQLVKDFNMTIDYDLLDFGVSITHTDKEGNVRKIIPFSEEWNEIIKQTQNKKP